MLVEGCRHVPGRLARRLIDRGVTARLLLPTEVNS
jgi:hypothetical protein